jgi:hypothetical protein
MYAQAIQAGDTEGAQRIAEAASNYAAGKRTEPKETEFSVWRQQNPNSPVSDYLKLTHPRSVTNVGSGLTADEHAGLVQGLVDGTLSVAQLGRMGQGEKLRLVAEAKKLDPSFDMTTYPSRQRVAEDFASGKSADQIQSFNTFLAHAKDLSEAVNDFRQTGSPLINKSYLWLKKNSGDPQVAAYLAKVEPVRQEFQTFLNNNFALTQSDKDSAAKVLDDSLAPSQMQAVIKSMSHTAALRLKEVNKKYRNTMRKDYPGLLDDANAQFLRDTGNSEILGSVSGSAASSDPFAAFGGSKLR